MPRIVHHSTVVEKVAESQIVDPRTLTLDEIEQKMTEIALSNSNDIVQNMINEHKIAMLEKVANLKIKRLQLKNLETVTEVSEVKPIAIKFISANTEEQRSRIERIDDEILKQSKLKQNA